MKQYTDEELAGIAARCKEHVECDTARVIKPQHKMYLIIGFNRSAKDDGNVRFLNRKPIEYNYIHEMTITCIDTEEELIESTKRYTRLCNTTWEEYLEELQQTKRSEQ
jgi:hypothetical protein